jgi:hypothetical protein
MSPSSTGAQSWWRLRAQMELGRVSKGGHNVPEDKLRSRKGNWVVKRKTAKGRFTRAVRSIAQWCRLHRHQSIRDQQRTLCQKLRGHYAYYGITGNSSELSAFRTAGCWNGEGKHGTAFLADQRETPPGKPAASRSRSNACYFQLSSSCKSSAVRLPIRLLSAEMMASAKCRFSP